MKATSIRRLASVARNWSQSRPIAAASSSTEQAKGTPTPQSNTRPITRTITKDTIRQKQLPTPSIGRILAYRPGTAAAGFAWGALPVSGATAIVSTPEPSSSGTG
jgi:hypothetical protein